MSAVLAVAPPVPEDAMTVPEVAAMLRVSEDTVYTKARNGDLPAFRVGRRWRFWPSEIRAALAPKREDPWAMPAASRRARRAK